MCDAISREAAIQWVKTECNPYGKPTLDFESGKRVMEHLGQMPSIESKTKCIAQIRINHDDMEDLVNEIVDKISKPKTGKWIEENFIPHCSECGRSSVLGGRFCPNCGARMLGEDGE